METQSSKVYFTVQKQVFQSPANGFQFLKLSVLWTKLNKHKLNILPQPTKNVGELFMFISRERNRESADRVKKFLSGASVSRPLLDPQYKTRCKKSSRETDAMSFLVDHLPIILR